MKYEIEFGEEAQEDLSRYRPYERVTILDLIEKHLRYEPTRESKSRIKALRGMRRPQYRLRIDNIRVFYDIKHNTVEIIAVVDKTEAAEWLEQEGIKMKSEVHDENSGIT